VKEKSGWLFEGVTFRHGVADVPGEIADHPQARIDVAGESHRHVRRDGIDLPNTLELAHRTTRLGIHQRYSHVSDKNAARQESRHPNDPGHAWASVVPRTRRGSAGP